MQEERIVSAYAAAKKRYEDYGVDADAAVKKALGRPISVHCWQGDDLTGFITGVDALGDGGIMATGNFPGKARTPKQLRDDMDLALKAIPGEKRVSLHAVYAETEQKIDLSEVNEQHFDGWIAWAKARGYGLDFNPTCFSHPMASGGYTLASRDEKVRRFWIDHVKNTRKISAYIGKAMGTPCVNNIWIPDGEKDNTLYRYEHRKLLKESLDEILDVKYDPAYLTDTVESKLFGIGSESFVAGSHEFYLLYALQKGIVPCMDMGHFHPTESVADKISAMLQFLDRVQIHTSRGVRWDSDHVAIYDDSLIFLMQEIARADAFGRVLIALDYFDGSINRLSAWAVGGRATRKAILYALLEPVAYLRRLEDDGDFGSRLAELEEAKTLPFAAVWDYACMLDSAPVGADWLTAVKKYEEDVLIKRK